jgi:hypothetical protein
MIQPPSLAPLAVAKRSRRTDQKGPIRTGTNGRSVCRAPIGQPREHANNR